MGDEHFKTSKSRFFIFDVITIMWFAIQMLKKLWKHRYKKHWSIAETKYLRARVNGELNELDEIIHLISRLQRSKTRNLARNDAIKECADAANFLMMIADNLKKSLEKK